MAPSKTRITEEKAFLDTDFEGISEEEETKCADNLWAYIEAHKDEVEDLEEWAKKRGLRS